MSWRARPRCRRSRRPRAPGHRGAWTPRAPFTGTGSLPSFVTFESARSSPPTRRISPLASPTAVAYARGWESSPNVVQVGVFGVTGVPLTVHALTRRAARIANVERTAEAITVLGYYFSRSAPFLSATTWTPLAPA